LLQLLRRPLRDFRWGVLPVPGRFLAVAFLTFLFIFPLITSDRSPLHLLNLAAIFAMFAVSWDLLSGYTGQVNFGHALFFGAGGYATAALCHHLGWQPWLAVPLGAVIAALVGTLTSLPALRLRPPYLSLLTLAFPLILREVMKSLPREIFGGFSGFRGFPKLSSSPVGEYYIIILVVAVSVLVMWKLTDARSKYIRTGLIFHAIREDEIAARATGINTVRYKILAFAIGGFFAGLAGALHAHVFSAVDPSIFSMVNSFTIIIYVVFGGIVSIYGPVVGVYVLYPLVLLLQTSAISQYRFLIMTGLVILVLLFMPEGVAVWIRDKIERECPRCKLNNVAWRKECRACGADLR
jgi:branched-chain amino acid transport system permease protein